VVRWFEAKFSKDRYAYFLLDEKGEVVNIIVHINSNEKFINLNVTLYVMPIEKKP